jgi:hypothetical protein
MGVLMLILLIGVILGTLLPSFSILTVLILSSRMLNLNSTVLSVATFIVFILDVLAPRNLSKKLMNFDQIICPGQTHSFLHQWVSRL